MPVFVPLICTHINQITFCAGQIPIWVLQCLITSEKSWVLCSQTFFFLWSTIPFLKLPAVVQTALRATLFPQKWKETLLLISKAHETSPWKHDSVQMLKWLCWEPCSQEIYPMSNEVHTQADLSWELFWKHQGYTTKVRGLKSSWITSFKFPHKPH